MTQLPPIKLFCKESFLKKTSTDQNFIECYTLAVDARPNKALLFTVYTEEGAIYSGLPLEALLSFVPEVGNPYEYINEELQPYSCLEGPVSVIKYDLLQNAELSVKMAGNVVNASYLFTISYSGDGLASDPEQFKTHNIVALYNGQLSAQPNNHCLFRDNWFAGVPTSWPKYDRQKIVYKSGG